jgi:hypothetical protein
MKESSSIHGGSFKYKTLECLMFRVRIKKGVVSGMRAWGKAQARLET